MKTTYKVKRLKDGRFKFTLYNATASVLHFDGDELPDYLFALLHETLHLLEDSLEPRLHKSQVLAMLQFASKYIDEPTQVVIVGLVKGAGKR